MWKIKGSGLNKNKNTKTREVSDVNEKINNFEITKFRKIFKIFKVVIQLFEIQNKI